LENSLATAFLTFSHFVMAMIDHVANIIAKLGALRPAPKRMLVQVPAGLKTRATELIEALEKHGYSAILAADECFGACDLPLAAAEASGADAVLHIGHVPFYKPIKSDVPVAYYEWPIDVEIDETKIKREINNITEKKIGLVSSVQYLHLLPKIAEIIKAVGKDAIVGGHLLGCWTKNAEQIASKSDALLFVGSGMFHPCGFECDYFFDLERGEIRDVRNEIAKWEKIKWGRIAAARNAITFGILVSTKPGQLDMERAEMIKQALEKRDKKAFILVMDRITDATLLGLDVDAFINTACPRLMDDKWSKPFVNAADVEKLFNE
jgi:2-(3-amino-3-carboxypropyl)histidine synthase